MRGFTGKHKKGLRMMLRHEPHWGSNQVRALFTRARPKSAAGRALQFPLVRIVLVLLSISSAVALSDLAVHLGVGQFSEPYGDFLTSLRPAFVLTMLIAFYRLYCRIVEKRQPVELGSHNCFSEAVLGVLLGAGLAAAVAVLIVKGSYRFDQVLSPPVLLKVLIPLGVGVFLEELVFRVTVFRLSEEFAGSWMALFAVGALSGLFHTVFSGTTTQTFVTVFVAGLLLNAAFMWTRRIWMVWGTHFGWAFAKTSVFGLPSGDLAIENLLHLKIGGMDWPGTKSLGFPASLAAPAILLLATLLLLFLVVRRNHLIGPSWKS